MSTVVNESKPKTKKNGEKKLKKTSEESLSEKVVEVVEVVEQNVTPILIEEEKVVVPQESILKENEIVSESSSTEILFNKLILQFQDIQSVMKTLHSNLKVLQKEVLKEQKDSKKKESKNKKKSDKKKAPSGFAVPSLISNDLADFLNVPHGSELARTEVTSKVIQYVKDHNLQNPEKKVQIIPDDKLTKILKQDKDDVIRFFNLQTYLKKHFLPKPIVEVV